MFGMEEITVLLLQTEVPCENAVGITKTFVGINKKYFRKKWL